METLEQRVQRHEGLNLKLYHDSLGFATIGYGRNVQSKGISADEALLMLRNDIRTAQQSLIDNLPWVSGLDDLRREVLVEMAFQLGINGLLDFRKTLDFVQSHQYDSAADEMVNSTWHTQTPKRCEELAEIMRTGCA